MKENLARIAQKIEENEFEKDGPFRMTDMIRGMVSTNTPDDVMKAYEMVSKIKNLKIIRIKNKIISSLQNVTINFIWWDCIIGEIQLRFGEAPVQYNGNHFIYELARADTLGQFQQQVMIYCNHLAEKHQIYASEKHY